MISHFIIPHDHPGYVLVNNTSKPNHLVPHSFPGFIHTLGVFKYNVCKFQGMNLNNS